MRPILEKGVAFQNEYVSIDELCRIKNLRRWRVYEMSRRNLLPVRHVLGKPILPYQINLIEFEKLESTASSTRVRSGSLKTKEVRVPSGHRKEKLWLK